MGRFWVKTLAWKPAIKTEGFHGLPHPYWQMLSGTLKYAMLGIFHIL
jgi:hypothetical protein